MRIEGWAALEDTQRDPGRWEFGEERTPEHCSELGLIVPIHAFCLGEALCRIRQKNKRAHRRPRDSQFPSLQPNAFVLVPHPSSSELTSFCASWGLPHSRLRGFDALSQRRACLAGSTFVLAMTPLQWLGLGIAPPTSKQDAWPADLRNDHSSSLPYAHKLHVSGSQSSTISHRNRI